MNKPGKNSAFIFEITNCTSSIRVYWLAKRSNRSSAINAIKCSATTDGRVNSKETLIKIIQFRGNIQYVFTYYKKVLKLL